VNTTAAFELVVNGAVQQLPERPATVGDLVRALNLAGKRIAVERNGEIVPKGRYDDTAVTANDRFEIVAAVGGG
jgi:sulfur carrier protein